MDTGSPVRPHNPMAVIRERELPVRVVTGDEITITRVPVGSWDVGDIAAMRHMLELIGFEIVHHHSATDPDGCVWTVQRQLTHG